MKKTALWMFVLSVFLLVLTFNLPAQTVAAKLSSLAPAWITDDSQIRSKGPEPTTKRTGKEPAPTKKSSIRVGFTPTAMNTHYDIVISGAKAAVKELGGDDVIDLVIQAPSGQSATAEQMNIVESWIQQDYDAIAIATANDQAMTPAFREAAKKGIPIFIFNTPIAMSVNPYYVSNVGYSQYEGGRLAGLWLLKNYEDKPTNLVVIEGLPGGPHNIARMAGFKEAMKDSKNIKVIASQPADWVRHKGQSVMENILTAHPDDIDVVWGMYDEMALGAMAAIKSHGKAEKIDIIGYDNTPDAYNAIMRGEMDATVDTAPKEMGYNLIQAIKKYVMDGEMVPKVINSEIAVWDQSDIKKFDTGNFKE